MRIRCKTLEELAHDIIDRRVYTDEETDCWLWKPGQWNSGNGYGKVSFKGRAMMAHRVVYEVFVGPIAEGAVLDHKCRRRACCNPDPEHLEQVTVKENTYRGLAVLFEKTE